MKDALLAIKTALLLKVFGGGGPTATADGKLAPIIQKLNDEQRSCKREKKE